MALVEVMKNKFKLEKKEHRYAISNINKPVVKVVTQILEGKVKWKCRVDEVPAPMVALEVQCAKGVQLN